MPGALQLSDARQPRYAAGSLAQGLVCAIHWGWQHRAVFNSAQRTRGGVTIGFTGSNSHIRHRDGLSGIGWSTSAVSQYITACNENDIGVSGTTIYCLQRHTDTTLRIGGLFGVNDAGTLSRRCGATAPYSDGTVYWDYGGATAGATRVAWTGLGGKIVNRLNRWCFVAAPRGMELWHQGILRGSHSTAASRTTSADDLFMINSGNGATTTVSDLSEFYLFLVWNRGLSQGEVRRLDANPWQVFATSDTQRSFVPGAAAASTVYVPGLDQRNVRHSGRFAA